MYWPFDAKPRFVVLRAGMESSLPSHTGEGCISWSFDPLPPSPQTHACYCSSQCFPYRTDHNLMLANTFLSIEGFVIPRIAKSKKTDVGAMAGKQASHLSSTAEKAELLASSCLQCRTPQRRCRGWWLRYQLLSV